MDSIDKLLLESFEKNIKSVKKNIKWMFIFVLLNIFFLLFYGTSFIINIINDKIFVYNFILFILWIVLTSFNVYTFKKLKLSLKSLMSENYNFLKKVDHTKYIREQRLEKLKKLKKGLFH